MSTHTPNPGLDVRLRFAGHLGLRGPSTPLFMHTARSISPLDQLDRLAELGFAGVQDLFLKLRSPAEQAAIGCKLADLGLEMGSFGQDPHDWNRPLWSGDDPQSRDRLRRGVEESIEVRKRVGGGGGVCVSGLDPQRPRRAQIDAMTENLKRFGELAERGGLTLFVEAVADAWIAGLLINRLEEAADMVRTVNNPAVRLLFDIAHVHMAGDEVLAGLDRHRGLIGGVQAADTPGRVDVGSGVLDWSAIFGRLRKHGFRGLVEIEHMPVAPGADGENLLLSRLQTAVSS